MIILIIGLTAIINAVCIKLQYCTQKTSIIYTQILLSISIFAYCTHQLLSILIQSMGSTDLNWDQFLTITYSSIIIVTASCVLLYSVLLTHASSTPNDSVFQKALFLLGVIDVALFCFTIM